jgi:hypothetical protein
MVMEAKREIDHKGDFRDDLGAAVKAGKIVTDIAVALLNGKGQVLAGEELVFGDETMKAFPVVGQQSVTLDTDFMRSF